MVKLREDSVLHGILVDEYERDLRMKNAYEEIIAELPKGSLQTIKRNGNSYYYLKFRENGKMRSIYVGTDKCEKTEDLKHQIERRKKLKKYVKDLNNEIKWLEYALSLNNKIQ